MATTILEHGSIVANGAYSCVCSMISIFYLVACFCLSSTWTVLSFLMNYSYIVIIDYTYPLLTKTLSMSFNLLCWMFWGTYAVIQYWLYGTCNVIQFMFSAMFSWYFLLFAVLGMGILLQHKPYRVILTDYFSKAKTTKTTKCNKSMIGKKCKCKWKSMKGAKYPCTISGSNADGTYSIDYDDGDKDYNVKLERLTFSNLSNLDKNVKKIPVGLYGIPLSQYKATPIKPLSMKKAKALFEKEFGKDKFYAWECELSGGIWTRYDDAASYGIESSYRNGTKHQLTQQYPTSTKVFQYTLTFAGDGTGKQKNNETKVCRKIRRVGTKTKPVPLNLHQLYSIEASSVLNDSRDTPQLNEFNFAMCQFVKLHPHKEITRVDVYENKLLKDRFDKRKQKFKDQNKDHSPIWVFHGTMKKNIKNIFEHGFKVGGKDVSVANGRAYGPGIYTAIGPKTPEFYCKDSKQMILSLALLGKYVSSTNTAKDGADCWTPPNKGDWRIFKDGTQLLPRYVVHYK